MVAVTVAQAELEGLLGGGQPVTERVGEDPVELGQRAPHRQSRTHQADALNGQQAQHQDQGLLIREHEGRQLEPGAHPVAAGPAALGLHRDAHLLEAEDVAAHRAGGHLEPLGDLVAAHPPAGLEPLEQGEEALLGEVH